MRLINACALQEEYKARHGGKRLLLIDVAPTVDAVPVVRCKDCKHSERWYRDRVRCFLWCKTGTGVFEDGYCNYAERKK